MKKLSIFFILTVLSFVAIKAYATDLPESSIKLTGNSNTHLGNFEIKELPMANMNGESLRTFELTYEKAQKTVLIYLDERAKCRDYVVRSKNLEVSYRCKKGSFGVQLVSGKFAKYKPELNDLFLAHEEFEKQKQISEGSQSIEESLGIIASYYPNLLNRIDLLN